MCFTLTRVYEVGIHSQRPVPVPIFSLCVGRCIRVDWCDNAMRRKYPISAAGSFRVPQRGNVGSGSGNSLGFLSAQEEVVDLVDTDGRITPMAMKVCLMSCV